MYDVLGSGITETFPQGGGGTKVTHLIQIKHLGFFVAANDSFSSLSHVEKERDPPCDSSVMFRKVLHIIHQRRRINLTFFLYALMFH